MRYITAQNAQHKQTDKKQLKGYFYEFIKIILALTFVGSPITYLIIYSIFILIRKKRFINIHTSNITVNYYKLLNDWFYSINIFRENH